MRRFLPASALIVLALLVSACGSTDTTSPDVTADSAAAGGAASGDCPVETISIVVTVDQWADIVERLAGSCGEVTTVISGDSGDPHDFEPTSSDNAAFTDADLVVMNGLDYDHWAENAIDTLPDEPALVDAGVVVGLDEGANPHLWYGPDYVDQVAQAVTDELTALAPDASDYFTAQATAWDTDMAPYRDLVARLQDEATGTSYGATEPVFDYMAEAIGLVDATPEGFRAAAANESDPAPGDVSEFEELLGNGGIDILVYNIQTQGAIPEQLREEADANDVPVVEVTETMPEGVTSFVQWQVGQLESLAAALDVAR